MILMGTKGAIHGKNAQSFAKRARKVDFVAIMKNEVKPLLKKNEVVADLCTGSGQMMGFVLDKVKYFTAIEISDEMIKILKKNYGKNRKVRIIQSDVTNTSLPAKSFDTIICTFSLHHIKEGKELLHEAHRMLKPGGRFILVDMVFKAHWLHRLIEPFWRIHKAIKQGWHELYCIYRDEEQVEKLIKKAGFTIKSKKRVKRYKKGYRDNVYPTFLYVLQKPN